MSKLDTISVLLFNLFTIDLLHALIWFIYFGLPFFPLPEGSVYSIC